MLAILITLLVVAVLGYSLRSRSGRAHELIVRRPYNNRYNDASGARDDHLL
jgi:hypothetical protein